MLKKFSDDDIGKYSPNYPIATLSKIKPNKENLLEIIKDNIRFKYSNDIEKVEILSKFKSVLSITDEIMSKFHQNYPNLKVKHMSIGGSYLFKKEVSNDIDFDVIVEGSFFSYKDIFDIDVINNSIYKPVRKISFMIFGEDDLILNTEINDSIETADFIHTNLTAREGLIFNLRNITILGFDIEKKIPDKKNILLRIKKQLYHAELILNSKIYKYRNEHEKISKATGRVMEGMLYISQLFSDFCPKTIEVVEQEKELLKTCNKKIIKEKIIELKSIISNIESKYTSW